MKLRMVCPRAVAWRNRSQTGMLALAATGAVALTAATALALGMPAAGVQAAVASNAPSPAQAGTVPLPEMLLTVTSVPDGVKLVSYSPMFAYSALVLVASRSTFSSVRPSSFEEL